MSHFICGFYLGSKIDTDTVGAVCGSEFKLRIQKTSMASWQQELSVSSHSVVFSFN